MRRSIDLDAATEQLKQLESAILTAIFHSEQATGYLGDMPLLREEVEHIGTLLRDTARRARTTRVGIGLALEDD